VEVNSETDFVAKNEEFLAFVDAIAKTIAANNPADVEALKELPLVGGEGTVGEALTAKIAKIGENMNIRRFERIETTGVVVDYIHAAGKIGVLVEADAADSDAVKECLKNVAMQVAALNPKYLSSADIPDDYKEHEKSILIAQLQNDPKNASKPANIIEKMIEGRLAKEFKEVCLLEQEYVKAENKENVGKYVASVGDITVKKFARFETGEGLEKKEDNFADEVASMVK
ncbi:MAG: translation elongation factor Ts, partial [Clostridia bacterium]|nr:translation elongation factor Ts [Clostridia bacterium]